MHRVVLDLVRSHAVPALHPASQVPVVGVGAPRRPLVTSDRAGHGVHSLVPPPAELVPAPQDRAQDSQDLAPVPPDLVPAPRDRAQVQRDPALDPAALAHDRQGHAPASPDRVPDHPGPDLGPQARAGPEDRDPDPRVPNRAAPLRGANPLVTAADLVDPAHLKVREGDRAARSRSLQFAPSRIRTAQPAYSAFTSLDCVMHRVIQALCFGPRQPRERIVRYPSGDDGASSSERPVVKGPPQEGIPAQNSPESKYPTCSPTSCVRPSPLLLQIPESIPPLAV